MRCPECEQRNSVAAWKCKFCGAKFKRKAMSPGKKIVLITASIVLGGSIYLAFALPKLVDPSEQLMGIAKHVASGPKSPEDAKKSKADLEEAIKNLLLKYGGSNSNALAARLKGSLPANGPFEVLVVDLPEGLKLVEVDTVLQASDFLVMKGTNDTRVIPLPGFEVYDDARTVKDEAGKLIVLLGHSSGQLPHKPIIKTYALLPDSVVDDTAKIVPSILGEGSAKFFKENSNISIELSLPSVAQAEKISITPPITQDKTIKLKLDWNGSKYVPSMDFPPELHPAMLLLARCLKNPEFTGSVTASMGAEAGRLMKDHASTDLQEMNVQKGADRNKTSIYTISSARKSFELEMKKAGNNWQLAGFRAKVNAAPVQVSESKAADPVLTTTAPIETKTATNTTAITTSVNVNDKATTKTSATATNTGTKPGQEILANLTPEKAGSNVKNSSTQNKNDKGDPGAKGSSWVEDEPPGETKKPSVAVLPPGLKNSQDKAKEKAEQERKEKERKEKEKKDKAEKEKAEKERIARENEKQKETEAPVSGSGSAKIAEYLGTSSVRLRSGPGLNTNTLDEIPKGTNIQILGQKKGWYRISYKGKVGYVFAPLVDTSKGGAGITTDTGYTPPKKSEAAKTETAASHSDTNTGAPTPGGGSGSGATIVRGMNVRDEHRKVISVVKVGQHVVVLSGLVNDRYKIRMPDGTVGYVRKEAIQHVKVETPPEFVP